MRSLIALLAALALPTYAGAASLWITADAPQIPSGVYAGYYAPVYGSTLTLTIWGDDEDAASTYYSLFGRLLYSSSLTDETVSAVQTPVGTGWITGTTPQIGGESTVFDQLNFNGGTGDFLAPGGSPFATLSLYVGGTGGPFTVSWRSDLIFFGLTSAPGIGVFIVDEPIPEPSPHLLVALGLFALALGHRRRTYT